MDSLEYIILANEILEHICNSIEDIDDEGKFDCELSSGVLTIDTPIGTEYVINKHEASQQIWFSSPKSGAYRFSYSCDSGKWLSRDNNELFSLLESELKEFINIKL